MFNFFRQDKHKIDSFSEDNCIVFGINKKNNQPYLKINVMNTSAKDSEIFSNMIYQICDGQYQQDITKTIIDMSHQDLQINLFMQRCLINWAAKLNSTKIDGPIITPSAFSKNLK